MSASDDKTIKLWDRNTKECVHTFNEYSGYVNSVAFHPGGTFIAAGSTDSTLKIWDIRTNKLIQHYTQHTQAINDVSFHPGGNYIITASNDSTLKIFDLMEGKIFYTLHGHQSQVLSVAFSKGGDYFASAGNDEQVMVWKTNFDQIPYQELMESRNHKATGSSSQQQQQVTMSSKISSQTNQLTNGSFKSNVIHARPGSSTANASSQRDASPITIPLNESCVDADDDDNEAALDPTAAAIASATSAFKNNMYIQPTSIKNQVNKKLAHVSNGTKKPENENGVDHQQQQLSMQNVEKTLEYIVQQLDMLTQVNYY